MRAMILAAGRGTRLSPLTERTPKILVPVAGVPMLERLLAWLERNGVRELALNTHHLAEAVAAELERISPRFPGLRVTCFHEPELLGTGGALVNVRAFWNGEPLLVWNGDVIAEADLAALAAAHARSGALATLLVHEHPQERSRLLVDDGQRIVGIDSPGRGGRWLAAEQEAPLGAPRALAFTGISLLAPALLPRIERPGSFDLIDALLQAVAAGAHVQAFDLGPGFWGTCGSPAELVALERGLDEQPLLRERYTPAAS